MANAEAAIKVTEPEFACLCGGYREEHEVVDESGASVCHHKADCPCPRFREHGHHGVYVPGAAHRAYVAMVDELSGEGAEYLRRVEEAAAIDKARCEDMDLYNIDGDPFPHMAPHMARWLEDAEFNE